MPETTIRGLQESAADVKEAAATSASQVRDQAAEEVRGVADTAMEQTKQTARGFAQGLEQEANEQSQRVAQLLDGLGGELDQMSQNGSGWASTLVGDAAGRTKDLARWVETTEPRDMLSAVEDFARRRPVVFVAGSALAGLVLGRVTRSMMSKDGSPQSRSSQQVAAPLDTPLPPAPPASPFAGPELAEPGALPSPSTPSGLWESLPPGSGVVTPAPAVRTGSPDRAEGEGEATL